MISRVAVLNILALLAWPTMASAINDVGPNAITNLSANVGRTTVVLTWTAPSDQNSTGPCAGYDVRKATGTTTITECGFTDQSALSYGPPQSPGVVECMEIGGLTPNTGYAFAIRTQDAAGNWAVMSNVVSVTTLPSNSNIEAVCLLIPPPGPHDGADAWGGCDLLTLYQYPSLLAASGLWR